MADLVALLLDHRGQPLRPTPTETVDIMRAINFLDDLLQTLAERLRRLRAGVGGRGLHQLGLDPAHGTIVGLRRKQYLRAPSSAGPAHRECGRRRAPGRL